MSDPVTNIEIEDVLSSIRRLVADGDKLRAPAAPASVSAPQERPATEPLTLDNAVSVPPEPDARKAHHNQSPPVASDKFVLTPLHRVDTAAPEAKSDPERRPEPKPDHAAPTEALPAFLLWETDEQAETDEHAASEEQAGAEHKPAAPAPPTELAGDPAEDEDEDGSWPMISQKAAPAAPDQAATPQPFTTDAPKPYVTEGRSRLESTIAELEAAITGQSQDFEPDGSEQTPPMDWTDGAAQASVLTSRTIHRPSQIEDAEEVGQAPQAPQAPQSEKPQAAHIPQVDEQDALDGDLEETLTAYLEEEEILDEETLRNLVTEIVHQELQGALGERITRNVRKLVRREIYRVLSSQEFE